MNITTPHLPSNHNVEVVETYLRVTRIDALPRVFWQTIPERKDRRNSTARIPRTFNGTSREHLAILDEYNAAGDAVFLCIKSIDGPERRTEHDRGGRLLALDLDGAPMPASWRGLPPPHLIVETSPGRHHCIWRLAETLQQDTWRSTQLRLANAFGGDRSICNPAQTLRAPGFVHWKGAPFRSRIAEVRDGHSIDASVFQDVLRDVSAATATWTRRGTGGGRGLAHVEWDANGLVVDGREEWLAHLVFQTWRDQPEAGPDTIAAAALARFRATASLHPSRRYHSWEAIERDAVVKAHAVARKERRHARAAKVVPWTPPTTVTIGTAEETLKERIVAWLSWNGTGRPAFDPTKPRPRTAILATTGLGKSSVFIASAIDHLRRVAEDDLCHGFDGDGGDAWYLTSTVNLALELAEKTRNLAGDDDLIGAEAIRGRTHDGGEDMHPLCVRHVLVKDAAAAGVGNIYNTLCSQKDGDEHHYCPYFTDCEYLAQFERPTSILFGSSELLFVTRTSKLKAPVLVVLDELALNSFVALSLRYVNEIMRTAGRHAELVGHIVDELRHHRDPRAMLRADGVTVRDLRLMAREIGDREDDDDDDGGDNGDGNIILPSMDDEQIRARLSRITIPSAAKVLRHISDEMESEQPLRTIEFVQYETNRGLREQIRFNKRKNMRVKYATPILHFDGTGSSTLIDAILSDHKTHRGDERMSKEELEWRRKVEIVEINVADSADVTQITNFGASMGMLVPNDGSDNGYDEDDPEGSLEGAREYLRTIAAKLPRDRDLLLVTYKYSEEYLLAFLPPNVRMTHFGAFRGLDCFKDCDEVWIVGRNLPKARDVERIAKALLWDRWDITLNLTGNYVPAVVRWRLKSGEEGPLTTAWRHPDPHCEAIRENLCEAEIVQAIGRIRTIRATTTKRVVLISGVPTLPANRLIAWRDFIGEEKVDRFAELLVRENGVALLSHGKLANDHPDLFPTVTTARGAIERMVDDPPNELPTGVADVTTPVAMMRGKVRGERGAMAPVLTTLAGQPTAVVISRNAGADAVVEEPKPEPKDGEAPPLRGPRHYVMRAGPVEIDLTAPEGPKTQPRVR